LGFTVQGSGFRVRVQGLGFKVYFLGVAGAPAERRRRRLPCVECIVRVQGCRVSGFRI